MLGPADSVAATQSLVETVLAASARHVLALRGAGAAKEVTHASGYRAALDRFRAAVRTFEPLLDAGWSTPTLAELDRLLAAVEPVRDLAMLRDRLASRRAELDEPDVDGADVLAGQLDAHDHAALAVLLSALRSPSTTALHELMGVERIGAAVLGTPDAQARFIALVRGPLDALVALSGDLDRASRAPWLADVGRTVASARAAAEAARPMSAHALATVAGMADLQEALHRLRDAGEVERWLRAVGADVGAAGVTAGILVAAERGDAVALRRQVVDAWENAAEDVGLLLAKLRRLERRVERHGGRERRTVATGSGPAGP